MHLANEKAQSLQIRLKRLQTVILKIKGITVQKVVSSIAVNVKENFSLALLTLVHILFSHRFSIIADKERLDTSSEKV